MSVYSTPALRVGVYRCPPGDALWHETNDNIGDRPHVVFPDYAAADNRPSSGFAGVYSGRDGTLLHSWTGAAGDGLGPGRGAGDVNRDHRPDLLASAAEGDTVYMIAGTGRWR